jgi:GNAT superfamily N-acetyltransferase
MNDPANASLSADLLRQFDLVEASSWGTYYDAASADVVRDLGVAHEWIDGAVATALAEIDVLAYNRVIGLGLECPVSPSTVDRIIAFYRDHRVSRCFVQLHPDTEPDVGPLLEARGFRHHNNWVKLCRSLASAPRGDTPLRIEEIGPEHASTFASIITRSFEHPDGLQPFLAGAVGRPGYRAYLGFDGSDAIAAASLFIDGAVAELTFAGTLPDRRGRGAQGALIARRLAEAHDAGCEWIIAETGEDRPEHRVQSFRNLTSLGFHLVYRRPNYILELAATT